MIIARLPAARAGAAADRRGVAALYTLGVSEDQAGGFVLPLEGGRDETKREKKESKLREDAVRPLDAWERYRALVDTLEEAIDLGELADRKARFALIIMGALNVAFFVLGTRTDILSELPARLRPFLAFYLVVYGCVALFFFLEAIETLRPRRIRPHIADPGEGGRDHHPEGLRYYEDVVLRDVEAYRRAWREVRFGQLSAELAVQTHVVSRINLDKFRSLRRLYVGLRVLTILAGGLLAIVALSLVFAAPHPGAPGGARRSTLESAKAAPAAESSAPAPAALSAPTPVPVAGLREASGIAWDAARDHLFVVGDRGTLFEIERTGTVAARWPVKGNLEDVAVHAPSGLLVLLAEKKGELVVFDPAAGRETARIDLDQQALLGKEPGRANQGFEGLAFRPAAGHPGEGIFYLVHQRQPARLVAVAFDPARPPRTIGADDVVERRTLKPWQDLTAVTWSDALGRLLVVAESEDRLLVLDDSGGVDQVLALPGAQQEGLSLDSRGTVWLADDRLGVLRIDGALAALRSAVAPRSGGNR